jgi:hypothetical protein
MKALLVHVYKNDSFSNCSNGGVTSRHDTILLLHPRGNHDIDPDDPPDNLCKVVTRQMNFRGGYEYKHIEPYAPVERNKAGYMCGGSMGYTSDSRFGEFSLYPLKIHDRTE